MIIFHGMNEKDLSQKLRVPTQPPFSFAQLFQNFTTFLKILSMPIFHPPWKIIFPTSKENTAYLAEALLISHSL